MKKIKEFRERFWKMVEEAGSVVITSHVGPDDDSVSSMLAVYWLIGERFPGKKVRMVCSGEPTDEWKYFKGFEKIEFVGEVVDSIGKTNLLIMLDGSSFDRFSKKPEELKKLARKTICIDHHKNKPDKFDLLYVSAAFSATVEGVYRLLIKETEKDIPKELAEIFLLGILGDTGNFAFLNKETVKVLEIVQELILRADVTIQGLQGKYKQYPKRIMKLIGEMISNTRYFKEVGNWPAFQVGFLGRKFVDEGGYSDGDVSNASHLYMHQYLGSIGGYNWGFTITPRKEGTCSLSFRSLPGVVNVRLVAEMFEGGGHDLASGGEIKVDDPEKALEIILKRLK